jgi:POT family proton-dependent oligopeptide transporter
VAATATPITILLLQHTTINNILMTLLLALMIFILISMSIKQKTRASRNKIIAFLCLLLVSIIFWVLYSLEPSFLSVYIASNVNTHFIGLKIPATSFFAFDGVFVVLLGLVLSRLWSHLSKRDKNPSLPIKFGSSLGIIGLGFCFLALVAKSMGNSLMPSSYIVLAYAIFALAELLISPLGISMVGRLAPAGHEGLMMGFWQLCTGIGGAICGYVANSAHLPTHKTSLESSNAIYGHIFFIVGGASIFAGCCVLPFIHKLRHLIGKNDPA